ncbi:E3 ubiquitin-protein ligase XIAP [Kryptolebias marmoratus]|uniref:E3 ubiquitin-protein ligase XIAP n=1 Tax=Kryptolebias marmoratus TaxID=37003 RepID=A0A3Q3BCA6_KRYMA|nr:E3 ubiquitin-protein ligase XIAP [Kryptolebias marmoratus]
MCELKQDGYLESDCELDFSKLNNRLSSFHGSNLARQVPADRLARAGFYFTGNGDRVCCFSCQKTVDNWCSGDTPVERHKEVSPTCTFLKCCHRPSFNPCLGTSLTNGSTYDEAAEDMQYRLSTGAVVDETPYPMAPHMKSEEARLRSFSLWPLSSPMRPRDLAQAGFYYLEEGDHVQCFCCGGRLNGWEAEDVAWEEHATHFPRCFFILGHNMGNVPLQEDEQERESSQNTNAHDWMESFEGRLGSFAGLHHPVDHESLARAGFYSTGVGDKVKCFRCGGGLKGWQPEEDPWEEHAKFYPGCNFLLEEKGIEFINNVQLQQCPRSSANPSQQNGPSGNGNGIPQSQSEMARKAIEIGIEPSMVERSILQKIDRTGSGFSNVEALVEDCLSNTAESEMPDEDPLEKLRKLQMEKQCKICMDRDICIVFLPCVHLVTCKQCSESLTKCPICCRAITQKLKTYLA